MKIDADPDSRDRFPSYAAAHGDVHRSNEQVKQTEAEWMVDER